MRLHKVEIRQTDKLAKRIPDRCKRQQPDLRDFMIGRWKDTWNPANYPCQSKILSVDPAIQWNGGNEEANPIWRPYGFSSRFGHMKFAKYSQFRMENFTTRTSEGMTPYYSLQHICTLYLWANLSNRTWRHSNRILISCTSFLRSLSMRKSWISNRCSWEKKWSQNLGNFGGSIDFSCQLSLGTDGFYMNALTELKRMICVGIWNGLVFWSRWARDPSSRNGSGLRRRWTPGKLAPCPRKTSTYTSPAKNLIQNSNCNGFTVSICLKLHSMRLQNSNNFLNPHARSRKWTKYFDEKKKPVEL